MFYKSEHTECVLFLFTDVEKVWSCSLKPDHSFSWCRCVQWIWWHETVGWRRKQKELRVRLFFLLRFKSSVLHEERMSQRFGGWDANARSERHTLLQVERCHTWETTWRKVLLRFNHNYLNNNTNCLKPLCGRLTGCQEHRNTDQLTDSRSFSSGPRLCSSLVQEPFGPQLKEYEIGLSLGQSSSLGKPITLKKTQVKHRSELQSLRVM